MSTYTFTNFRTRPTGGGSSGVSTASIGRNPSTPPYTPVTPTPVKPSAVPTAPNLDDMLAKYKDKSGFDLGQDKDYAKYMADLKERDKYNDLIRGEQNRSNDFIRQQQLTGYNTELGQRVKAEDFGRDKERMGLDFGYQSRLKGQDIEGQQRLEDIRQSGMSYRIGAQIKGQQDLADRGYNQQNLFRAQSAALALRGLR